MKLIITVVAIIIAVLVAFAVSGVISENEKEREIAKVVPVAPKPIKIPEVEIYTASKNVEIGQAIASTDYEVTAWPAKLLPPSPIYASQGSSAVDGLIASAPIVKGEPLITSKLRNPNDPSFISGQLKEGMRAVTIPTNLVDSVAGFVEPGDNVDILITFDLNITSIDAGDLASTGGSEDQEVTVTEVLLPNVKVLAVDRRVSSEKSPDGKRPPAPVSVTLAVNQRDVQKLKLAESTAQLSLALRSLQDVDKMDKPRPTAEQDLTRLLPPAYFPALFDNDAPYDYSLIDLYGRAAKPEATEDGVVVKDEFMEVDVYRATGKQTVEVKSQ